MEEFPNKVHDLCSQLTNELQRELEDLKRSNATLVNQLDDFATKHMAEKVAYDKRLDTISAQLANQQETTKHLRALVFDLRADNATVAKACDDVLLQHKYVSSFPLEFYC